MSECLTGNGGKKIEPVFIDWSGTSVMPFSNFGEGYYLLYFYEYSTGDPTSDGTFAYHSGINYLTGETISVPDIYNYAKRVSPAGNPEFYELAVKVQRSSVAGRFNVYDAITGNIICSNCTYINWDANPLRMSPIFVPLN